MPSDLVISALSGDDDDLLTLNNRFAAETSLLDADEWRQLVAQARFTYAAGTSGFMVAMDQDSAYDGLNFQWFKDRFSRFAYVDRIVIGAAAHGQGLGRALYDRLFDEARAAGLERVACEVNIDPPNPGSVAFHEKLGFAAVGERLLPNGKTVRYLIAGRSRVPNASTSRRCRRS